MTSADRPERQATNDEIAWWARLEHFQVQVHDQLTQELRRTGLSLTTYLALDRFVRHAGPLRIAELAAAVHLTPSSASRLVDRLVADGYLTRSVCGEDRRGVFVHLTDRGRIIHKKATPHYRTALARVIDQAAFSRTDPEEKKTSPILDTHVILRSGDKILMSQRGGQYKRGQWHLPSGKLDADEPLPDGAARELLEETGVTVDPAHLRMVHVVHHRQKEGDRVGFFFVATQWTGEPVNREPGKCLNLQWFDVVDLPDDIIEYPAAGLHGCLTGANGLSLHGW